MLGMSLQSQDLWGGGKLGDQGLKIILGTSKFWTPWDSVWKQNKKFPVLRSQYFILEEKNKIFSYSKCESTEIEK